MLEEPYQVLWEDDYAVGYHQMRHHRCVPCKCPYCNVWSHHTIQRRNGKALVKCPLCDSVFDAKKYQSRAVWIFRRCLRNYHNHSAESFAYPTLL